MTRILVLLVIVAVAAIAWTQLTGSPDPTPSPVEVPAAPQPDASAAVAAAPPREPIPDPERAAPSDPATQPPFDPSPTIVARYALRVLVLDPTGRPVPDATVQAFDARKSPPRAGSDLDHVYRPRGADATPIVAARTDVDGRCALDLDREMVFVMAAAVGVGRTNDLPVRHDRVPEELVLTLERQIRVDGLVLHADGTPAAGVAVVVRVSGGSSAGVGFERNSGPLEAGPDGRFVFYLQPNTIYSMRARDGERYTFGASVSTTVDQRDRQVTLEFPGARSVHGFVFDADGRPVPGGTVRLWEEYEIGVSDPNVDPFVHSKQAAVDGRFEIDVPKSARYRLVASAYGHANTAPTWVEVQDARPDVDVDLRLGRLATIKGVVVDGRGAPIAGAAVGASAEQGEWQRYSAIPTRDDLFPRVEETRSGTDGTFELTGVHPGTTWQLNVIPDVQRRRVSVSFPGQSAGTGSVTLRVSNAQRRGSAIHGSVVEAATGAPVADYGFTLATYADGELRGTTGAGSVERDGAEFVVGDIPLGARVGVIVRPKDFAPVLLGPIDTTAARHEVVARVVPYAQVTCRVVDAGGAPVFGIRVGAREVEPVPGGPFWSAIATDQQGERRFAKFPPGPTRFRAWSEGDELASVEVDLRPGPNADVVLTIAR